MWRSCAGFVAYLRGDGLHVAKLLARLPIPPALQSQNAENLKQIFPEKEYRGLSPYVSVSDLYIPTLGLPVRLE